MHFGKLDEILLSISQPPVLKTDSLFQTPTWNQGVFEKKAVIALERDVMVIRHHRTSEALATRTWIRFMSLIFGAILVVIGSAFILGKISTTIPTSADIGFGDFKGSLATSSPGIALVIIGGLLIGVPHISGQTVTTDDTSSFIAKGFSVGMSNSGGLTLKPSEMTGVKAELDEIRRKHTKTDGGVE